MQRVAEEPIETIHLYVMREKEKRPYSLLPLVFAVLCLLAIVAVTIYSGEHPTFEHKTLRVPAILLPLKTFSTSTGVIPTGIKTYPATQAQGVLTITNGSILSQELPKGMIFTSKNGTEVVTDETVFVPAGSAAGYGAATVSAHMLTSGINMSTLSIDQVIGTSLYVRNLQPFTGGRKAYSVTFVTHQDKLRAINQARNALTHMFSGLLIHPCREVISGVVKLVVKWTCQFVTYHVPSSMKVIRVRVSGNQIIVDVSYVVMPRRWTGK